MLFLQLYFSKLKWCFAIGMLIVKDKKHFLILKERGTIFSNSFVTIIFIFKLPYVTTIRPPQLIWLMTWNSIGLRIALVLFIMVSFRVVKYCFKPKKLALKRTRKVNNFKVKSRQEIWKVLVSACKSKHY